MGSPIPPEHPRSVDAGNRPLGPVLEFMRLMWAVNHRLDRASRRMQLEFGVTGPQRLAIRIVSTFPGLSAGDLARTLHIHPSTLTGILQRLESRGLLRRQSDPDDARRVRLELTAKGRRLTAPAVGTVEASIKRLLARWSETELDTTRRALSAIAAALDEPGPRRRAGHAPAATLPRRRPGHGRPEAPRRRIR